MGKDALLQIGKVSERTGLSIHAIRFYEKEGLLQTPARRPGGFRLYSGETVERLLFIQKAQELGLTLKEIKEITCCGDKGLGPCCDLTVDLFSKKVEEFEKKTRELNQMKRKLKTVLGRWAGKKPKK
jgi:DNA-binding transcriptional MerR regulator